MTMHYRSIWISDSHLGARDAQAAALDGFLAQHTSDNLYLVGDFIDFWALRRKVDFPQAHVDVLQKVLKRASQGTRIVYVVGNHDGALRKYLPLNFGRVEVCNEYIHALADGRKLLIIHGDQYDHVMNYAPWLVWLGDLGYTLLLRSNGVINRIRGWFGLGYFSLSAYAKRHIKSAVCFIGQYEQAAAAAARRQGVAGIVCGHIHQARLLQIGNVLYANCGDWVENLTALVEDEAGGLSLLHWGHATPPAIRT